MSRFVFLIIIGILLAQIPIASAFVEVECYYPGQYAEAGDDVEFELKISNYANSSETYDLKYTVYKAENWTIDFKDNDKTISKVYVPGGSSRDVILSVETSGDADVGEYPIYVRVGGDKLKLTIEITETHKGEKGTLSLKVTNKDGDSIKGAKIDVYKGEEIIDSVKTTVEGKTELELPKGEYMAEISKEGYYSKETDDFKIKIGRTNDLGIISLEQKEYFAEISSKSPSITANVGENPIYMLKIKNSGKTDDTYELDIEGLPEDWYHRYKETKEGKEELSSIFILSGEEKILYLEFVPPYDVETGEYNFTASILSSTEQYELDLSLKLRGSYEISLYSGNKLRYDVNRGDTVTIEMTVSNTGLGGTITNIKPEINAPMGWTARSTPKEVASIKPGESETFIIKIIPPGDIATSDYKVSVNVKSDQLEENEDFRIVIEESSNVPMYGALIIIVVLISLVFMFKKYGRR
ncbi:MAG: NEW3 domain-containing protein [Halobacteriota archaeon]|nr:NEW3 domain-containing protein [Halobacteriota archaeon]